VTSRVLLRRLCCGLCSDDGTGGHTRSCALKDLIACGVVDGDRVSKLSNISFLRFFSNFGSIQSATASPFVRERIGRFPLKPGLDLESYIHVHNGYVHKVYAHEVHAYEVCTPVRDNVMRYSTHP
jgi:hypothetical protein